MILWRLTRRLHLDVALRGVGAARFGGRWNSPGTAIGYTATSLQLAVLELLVNTDLDVIPNDYVCVEHRVDDQHIASIDPTQLAPDWNTGPPYPRSSQRLGDAWIAGFSSLGLRVPAAVLPVRDNLLINPRHPRFEDIERIDVQDFQWPARWQLRQ